MAHIASPYAAPHTPIASSKRPRASSTKKVGEHRGLDLASPVKLLRYTDEEALSPMKPIRIEKHTKTRGNAAPTAANPGASAVPIALFSPFLCRDDDNDDGDRSGNGKSSPSEFNDENGHCDDRAVSHALRFDEFEDSPQDDAKVNLQTVTSTPIKSQGNMTPPSNGSTSSAAVSASSSSGSEYEATAADEEESEDMFNPFVFIINLPPRESVPDSNKICLPPLVLTSRPTLVLDLDETLVHCTVEKVEGADMTFPVDCNGIVYEVHVRKRPYLDYFLQTVAKSFEVVVFTASQKIYADVLLDKLDPDNRYIHHRLFRESCVLVHGNYLKDLTVLGRDLARTVLVDNSPHAYGYHVDNGIPIESWFDDSSDTELLKLAAFLKNIHKVDDVRHLVHHHFKTHELLNHARTQQNRLQRKLSA